MHNKIIVYILLGLFLTGFVSSQTLSCPQQLVRIGDEIKFIAKIDYGDVQEYCLNCVCTARLEDSKGNTLSDDLSLTNKGNGFYVTIASSPTFIEGNDYYAFTSCSNVDGDSITGCAIISILDTSSGTIPDDDGGIIDTVTNYINTNYFDGVLEDYTNPFSKYFNMIDDTVGEFEGFLGSIKQFGTTSMEISESIGLMFGNPASFIANRFLPYLWDQLMELIKFFLLPVFFLELILIIYSLLNGNDLFDGIRNFFNYNHTVFMMFIGVFVPLFNIGLSLYRLVLETIGTARNMFRI